MTALNKQALRQIATDAHELGIIKRYTKGIEANKRFVAIATPLTVLALLNELEAAEKRIAELETRAISIPEVRITVAESKRKNLTWRELGAYNEGADVSKEAILAVIRAAGIGVKGE